MFTYVHIQLHCKDIATVTPLSWLQDALRESLENKFKKERRPLIGNSMVQQMHAKFAVEGSGRKCSFPGQPSQLLHNNRHTVCMTNMEL